MKVKKSFQLKMGKKKIFNKKTFNNEDIACLSLVLYYAWQTGNLFVQKCIDGGRMLIGAAYLLLVAGTGMALLSVARKRAAYGFLAELTVLFLYAISYVLGYANTSVLGYYFFWTFMICVPIGLSVLCMNDWDRLLSLLYRMAKPMTGILCGIIFLRFIVLRTNISKYDQSLSYAVIFWCIILCNAVIQKIKLADLFFLLMGLGFNFLWGSRGTYLCFALFLLLKTVLDVDTKRRKVLIFSGITLLLVVVAIFLFADMSKMNSDEMVNFRNLYLIMNGDLFRSDSRVALYIYYAGLVLQKPFLGWGVTGGWIDSGLGPHNFFLEVLLSFGIMIGMAIFVIGFYLIVGIMKNSKKSERTLFIIYFSNTISLIVSGSFLQNLSFYICLFLIVSHIGRRRRLRC